MTPFAQWFETVAGVTGSEQLRIADAFEIAVCRIEEATRQRAIDPIRAVSNSASHASRIATKVMLRQLGLTDAQVRVMQRILAGSTSGWPGLIRLYLAESELDPVQRRYLRRQIRQFCAEQPPGPECA